MSRIIKIKKGLNVPLQGEARLTVKETAASAEIAVFPDDFVGLTPKPAVKQGDKVLAGTPVLFDKNYPDLKIVSPVSGEVTAINRGEKRRLLSVNIASDGKNEAVDFGISSAGKMSPEEIKKRLAEAGMFAYIRQRPYDVIANPADSPRDIFVSGFYSAPLSPSADFILKGEEAHFQTGLDVLATLTKGKVYLSIHKTTQNDCLKHAKNVEVVAFDGPHPAGNVGVQINHIQPVNKGETVWTLDVLAVLFIGRLFDTGKVDFSRLVALTGSEVDEEASAYYKLQPGTSLGELLKAVKSGKHLRYISGDVLTGTQIAQDGSLHAYDKQITVIPEGDDVHEFFGWIAPGFDKFSVNHSYPTQALNLFQKKKYALDARVRGGRRAMIMSDEWDKVFPFDILPEPLIRAILSFDIEKMENLGIYEIAPEDFALCEFVDTSKMGLQNIVREGLDRLRKE